MAFSPDGKYVAYLDLKSQRHAVRPIAGGEPVMLAPRGMVGRAVWSPDGDSIYSTNYTAQENCMEEDEWEKMKKESPRVLVIAP